MTKDDKLKRVTVMSRNLSFFILGLISAVLAYFFHPLHADLVELVISERLPQDFVRMLQNSDLVAFAGLVCLFGISFVGFYLIFPVFYVWSQIYSARNIVAELPLASNPAQQTDKKTFLTQLSDLGFINQLAVAFGSYLTQKPEVEVTGEVLKKARIIKRLTKSDTKQTHMIAPVMACASADVIFNRDSLVTDSLLLGVFQLFARILIGIGVICLGISIFSYSPMAETPVKTIFLAAQPGMVALLYCLTSAIIMAGLIHLVDLVLSQNVSSLARGINDLFHQNEWQQEIDDIKATLDENSIVEQLENIFQTSLNKPMREISKAVKALSVDQEKKLDNILSNTLDVFVQDLHKKTGKDTESLNKALKDAAQSADTMKKQFSVTSSEFTKNMNKQATVIALHLADMQKVLNKSEQTTQKGTEKIVSSLADELAGTQKRLGTFFETSLKKLEERQKTVEAAVTGKGSILDDLHKTAKDLAIISNASGTLLETFNSLSSELNVVLQHIQETGIDHINGRIEKRDKIKQALQELKKANSDKIGKLPDI